ncbi:MAG: hypothetical protein JZU49_04115 [Sulfuricurvum sp.]|nr:hypothetical protein [Sulfuricurvum sp.]
MRLIWCALLLMALTMGWRLTPAQAFDFNDLEKLEKAEQEDLLAKAGQAARAWNFSTAHSYLKQAEQKGYASGKVQEVAALIAQNESAKAEKERREEEAARVAQQQDEEAARVAQQQDEDENLKKICSRFVSDWEAYSACMKNEGALKGLGERGLKALYATQGRCDYLAGIDTNGLSYLCSNPNFNGCMALQYSQDTKNACVSCGGSNLWLRVFATGKVLRCY